MAIPPHTRLGSYEITSALGSGGMGEVYRARDLRLGRNVALKILGERFVLDTERQARFERETRVLASLNHPNIATLYGTEQIDHAHALVMELVDGETLAERIARGPIPLREAVGVAVQITAALAAAHEHGVMHRDLKPANVKIRPDGTVKLLDFGLAKVFDQSNVGNGPDAPTATSHELPGAIMGTPAYMSPEQARGLAVDKRTDIWAFGCVLFEMLTGRQAFGGERTSDVIARIIEREPDFSIVPATTPSRVVWLLRRCLAKDTRERLRDSGDAQLELEQLRSSDDDVGGDARPRRVGTLLFGVGGGAAAVFVLFWLTGLLHRPDVLPEIRFSVVLPGSQVLQAGAYQSVAISPAATDLAYIAGNRVYVRGIGESEPRLLTGTTEQGEISGIFFHRTETRSPSIRLGTRSSERYRSAAGRPRSWRPPRAISAGVGARTIVSCSRRTRVFSPCPEPAAGPHCS